MSKLCVNYDGQGFIYVLGTPETVDTCPYVLTDSGALELAPFNISSQDGILIAGAIISVWAIGFIARIILKIMIYR